MKKCLVALQSIYKYEHSRYQAFQKDYYQLLNLKFFITKNQIAISKHDIFSGSVFAFKIRRRLTLVVASIGSHMEAFHCVNITTYSSAVDLEV